MPFTSSDIVLCMRGGIWDEFEMVTMFAENARGIQPIARLHEADRRGDDEFAAPRLLVALEPSGSAQP